MLMSQPFASVWCFSQITAEKVGVKISSNSSLNCYAVQLIN